MGVNNFEYGDDLQGFIKLESTYGVAAKPTASDAFRAIQLPMAFVPDRPVVPDRRGTRSRMERVDGRSHATWGATILFRPSGSLGVVPDFGDILRLVFGTETVNGGTSVVYTLLEDLTGLSASVYRQLTNGHHFVYGAIVQNFNLSWRGNDFIRMTLSGIAKGYGETNATTADGADTTSTSLVVADADFLSKYSIVSIGGDDNSGAGYQVTALDHATETATITPAASWSNTDPVAPFLPTPSFTGDPIYGTKSTVSLDGGSTTVKNVGGSLSVVTGADLLNEEGDADSPTDVIMTDQRAVDLSLDFLVRKSEANLFSHYRRRIAKDLRFVLGDTAAKRMQIDADNVEIDPNQYDVPDTGLVRVTLPGMALGASGEDEVSITLN